MFIQYGTVSMKNKTVEEAYLEMLKPAETVTFRVQHRLDEFNLVKDTPGDGFYIRYSMISSASTYITIHGHLPLPYNPMPCVCCSIYRYVRKLLQWESFNLFNYV